MPFILALQAFVWAPFCSPLGGGGGGGGGGRAVLLPPRAPPYKGGEERGQVLLTKEGIPLGTTHVLPRTQTISGRALIIRDHQTSPSPPAPPLACARSSRNAAGPCSGPAAPCNGAVPPASRSRDAPAGSRQ